MFARRVGRAARAVATASFPRSFSAAVRSSSGATAASTHAAAAATSTAIAPAPFGRATPSRAFSLYSRARGLFTTHSAGTAAASLTTAQLLARVALISSLAAATAVGTSHLMAEPAVSMASASASVAASQSSVASSAASPSRASSDEYVPPEPSIWDRVRSVWIPTSPQQLHEAEKRTFESIVFPYESRMVPIPADPILTKPGQTPETWYINTLTLRNSHVPQTTPLVLLHGFGAGIGLWLTNYNSLASAFSRVDMVDSLGWGGSTRADFEEILKRKIKAAGLKKTRPGVPKEQALEEYNRAVAALAEEFNVESLEQWRIRQGHEKMVLVGHSLGGYLSAAYALKYPDRVESLILASPIGVPHRKEVNFGARLGFFGRKLLETVRWAWWEASVTPLGVVRGLGRFGRKPVTGYVQRRFASSDEELAQREAEGQRSRASRSTHSSAADQPTFASSADESANEEGSSSTPSSATALELDDTLSAGAKLAQAAAEQGTVFDKNIVADYLYHLCAQPGSGEHAFARLFEQSGFFAHLPLIDRLPDIAAGPRHRVPTIFAYGSHDWMDTEAGRATTAIINGRGGHAQTLIVERAGHQLFIDNPKDFLRVLKQAVAFGRTHAQQPASSNQA